MKGKKREEAKRRKIEENGKQEERISPEKREKRRYESRDWISNGLTSVRDEVQRHAAE